MLIGMHSRCSRGGMKRGRGRDQATHGWYGSGRGEKDRLLRGLSIKS